MYSYSYTYVYISSIYPFIPLSVTPLDRQHSWECNTQSIRYKNMPHNVHIPHNIRDEWINDDRESREGHIQYCNGRAQHPQFDAAYSIRYDFLQGKIFIFVAIWWLLNIIQIYDYRQRRRRMLDICEIRNLSICVICINFYLRKLVKFLWSFGQGFESSKCLAFFVLCNFFSPLVILMD